MDTLPIKYEKVPCKCGEKHNNELKTWMWSKTKIEAINDEGQIEETTAKVMRCRECRQIIWLQSVVDYE